MKETKLELLKKKADAICKQILLNKAKGKDEIVTKLGPIKDQIITEYNSELNLCQTNVKKT